MAKLFESHKSQMDLFMDNAPAKCVHTEHCCGDHGCKYGDEDCPVALKQKLQSYPCPYCPRGEFDIMHSGDNDW